MSTSVVSFMDSLFSRTGKVLLGSFLTTKRHSLSENLRNTIITPLCIVERDISQLDIATHIQMAVLDNFTAMYLAAFNKQMAGVISGATSHEILNSLATNRSLDENIETVLQSKDVAENDLYNQNMTFSLQAKLRPTLQASDDNEFSDKLNLSVGRRVTVSIHNPDSETEIPISIMVRLNAKVAGREMITDLVAANCANLDFSHRVNLFRYGEITCRELLTLSDVIDRDQRIQVRDDSGIMAEEFRKKSADVGHLLATGTVPINRASAIMVISSQTAREMRKDLGGSLDEINVRQRFFEGTAGMVIAIVDEKSEMVNMYYRGINDGQALRFKDCKKASKSDDLTDVLKALSASQTPTAHY